MAKTRVVAKVSKDNTSSRRRKLNRREKKKVVRQTNKLPNSFVILGRALKHLWTSKKLYAGIFIIYLLLYALLVKGLAADFQLTETKQLLAEAFEGELGGVETAATLFGTLIGSAGSTAGEAASVYQLILFVVFSLVIIRGLRSASDGKERIGIKQAFYQSSYPLIPFVLVGLVIILQSIPALLGLTLFGIISSNGIAVAPWEQITWFMVMLMGVFVSAYLLSSSIFASYIVTLPKMTPVHSLRSASKLVKYRRFGIIRKVLFLPLMLVIFAIVVFFPLAFYLPLGAEILFMIMSLAVVFVVHAYFYTLYRELL